MKFNPFAWYREKQRATDVRVLWSAIQKQAKNKEQAEAIFTNHAMLDAAWKGFELPIDILDELKRIQDKPQ